MPDMSGVLRFIASIPAGRFRVWRRWARAGRPRRGPVVAGEGLLLKCPVCHRCGLRGWNLEYTHVSRFLTPQDAWDYLALTYPRTWEMCPDCLEHRKGRLLW